MQWPLELPAAIYGVDFSGGALAGRNIWIARASPLRVRTSTPRLRIESLDCLESLSGAPEREPALAHLVNMVLGSTGVWGIDFPFGLPVELAAMGEGWLAQLSFLRRFDGDAKAFGLWCVDQAKKSHGRLHIRRTTDTDTKTPFDCYHYRIIYQTFHGMRDVLGALCEDESTAVLPFDYARAGGARRWVVEACPSSTLKRLRLPHQNYKQPAGGALLPKRRRTRLAILAGIEAFAEISPGQRRTIMRNGGGDALDAVIAAVGTWQSMKSVDHDAIRRHARYPREGHVYA